MGRSIQEEILINKSAEVVFNALITPSKIRAWWYASTAIVIPQEGGIFALTWGASEDAPDYISTSSILAFEPNKRLVLSYGHYISKTATLPFDAQFEVEFKIETFDKHCKLSVLQTGFPDDAIADEHYNGTVKGWKDTLSSIRNYLEG